MFFVPLSPRANRNLSNQLKKVPIVQQTKQHTRKTNTNKQTNKNKNTTIIQLLSAVWYVQHSSLCHQKSEVYVSCQIIYSNLRCYVVHNIPASKISLLARNETSLRSLSALSNFAGFGFCATRGRRSYLEVGYQHVRGQIYQTQSNER